MTSHKIVAATADPEKTRMVQEESFSSPSSSSGGVVVACYRLGLSLASLLVGSILVCAGTRVAIVFFSHPPPTTASSSSSSSSSSTWFSRWTMTSSIMSTDLFVSWHIKPIKPHHHGDVLFLTEKVAGSDNYRYKREFTVPCGDGILVFNIGPALLEQPYSYDIYQDNYAYSDNSGLCVIYPSYKGEQEADFPLWEPSDPTQQTIALGDTPNKISTRIVAPVKSKSFDASKKGGDFCIMRSGNFYNPDYYKHLKHEINTWPEELIQTDHDLELALTVAIQRVDAQMMQMKKNTGSVRRRPKSNASATTSSAVSTTSTVTSTTTTSGTAAVVVAPVPDEATSPY